MNAHTKPRKKQADAGQRGWRDELGQVAHQAALFALALAAGAGAVGASSWLLGEQHDALAHTAQARQMAAAKLVNVEIEQHEMHKFQPRFVQLLDAGLIGDEKRLEWTEAIRQIQAARQLLPISFEFEPQQAVQMAAPMALGDYQLRASRMHLHLDLLHEMDLFNFLGDLRARSLFTMQDCKIKRSDAPVDSFKTARLFADCTLNWVTLVSVAQVEPPVAPPRKRRGWR